jgi:hypothetical protein
MLFSNAYKFDRQTLQQVRIRRRKILAPWLICLLAGLIGGYTACRLSFEKPKLPQTYDELIVMVDGAENELVSPVAIYEYMKKVNIHYPEIVWSQVALESRFKSNICIENHNYFGMKKATCRPNVQTGENLGHATYRNWKMSVLDYALWQTSTGVYKLNSEEAYFTYLNARYAEDPNYALKVKEIRDDFNRYLELYEAQSKNKKPDERKKEGSVSGLPRHI